MRAVVGLGDHEPSRDNRRRDSRRNSRPWRGPTVRGRAGDAARYVSTIEVTAGTRGSMELIRAQSLSVCGLTRDRARSRPVRGKSGKDSSADLDAANKKALLPPSLRTHATRAAIAASEC